MRDARDALRDRVWSCVPVTGQAFAALLSLLEIECSSKVPTACVTTGERSRLLINPEFVAEYCRTDDHLAMLVLHELYHVLLGHTRMYPRVTPAQNWVFDCLINAQLCRLYPHPRYTSFFSQFVPGEGSVADLLAPPPGWHAGLEPGARKAARRHAIEVSPRLGAAHWRLYDDDSITTEELYRLLQRVAADSGERLSNRARGGLVAGQLDALDGPLDGVTLLGNHAAEDGDTSALHPEAMRELREIVARWSIVERRSGRDQGGELCEERVTLAQRRREAVAVLRRALARAAGSQGDRGPARRLGETRLDTLSPLDSGRDRRAAVQRALGYAPLLFAGQVVQRAPTPADRVRVYLDVSGSMEGVLGPLYAAMTACLDQVEPIVHGFSTDVGALTHAQLRAGVRLTTGGTDIETVTGHLLAAGARRALVVTDGWVGQIPEDHLREMRRRRVRLVAAVTAGGDPSFAADAGYPVVQLPDLERRA